MLGAGADSKIGPRTSAESGGAGTAARSDRNARAVWRVIATGRESRDVLAQHEWLGLALGTLMMGFWIALIGFAVYVAVRLAHGDRGRRSHP